MIVAEGWEWKVRVCSTGCIVHAYGGDCSGELQAHHVITQQQLRKHGLTEHRYEVENGVCLCKSAHSRHHSGLERVPYELLPDGAIRFAYEHGLDWVLDRYYPRAGLPHGGAA